MFLVYQSHRDRIEVKQKNKTPCIIIISYGPSEVITFSQVLLRSCLHSIFPTNIDSASKQQALNCRCWGLYAEKTLNVPVLMGSTFQKTDNTQINKQTNSLSGGDKYHEKNEVDEGEKKNLLGGGWVM